MTCRRFSSVAAHARNCVLTIHWRQWVIMAATMTTGLAGGAAEPRQLWGCPERSGHGAATLRGKTTCVKMSTSGAGGGLLPGVPARASRGLRRLVSGCGACVMWLQVRTMTIAATWTLGKANNQGKTWLKQEMRRCRAGREMMLVCAPPLGGSSLLCALACFRSNVRFR